MSLAQSYATPPVGGDADFFTAQGGTPNVMFLLDTSAGMASTPVDPYDPSIYMAGQGCANPILNSLTYNPCFTSTTDTSCNSIANITSAIAPIAGYGESANELYGKIGKRYDRPDDEDDQFVYPPYDSEFGKNNNDTRLFRWDKYYLYYDGVGWWGWPLYPWQISQSVPSNAAAATPCTIRNLLPAAHALRPPAITLTRRTATGIQFPTPVGAVGRPRVIALSGNWQLLSAPLCPGAQARTRFQYASTPRAPPGKVSPTFPNKRHLCQLQSTIFDNAAGGGTG